MWSDAEWQIYVEKIRQAHIVVDTPRFSALGRDQFYFSDVTKIRYVF